MSESATLEMDTDSTADTDSVASTSGFVKSKRAHLSPLCRRRSQRLKMKSFGHSLSHITTSCPKSMRMQTVKERNLLTKQKTIMFSSPSPLERMETEKRWKEWRDEPVSKKARVEETMNEYDNNAASAPSATCKLWRYIAPKTKVERKRPKLLNRVSTTLGLRMALTGIAMEDEEITKDKTIRLKRKATVLNSPEVTATKSILKSKGTKSAKRNATFTAIHSQRSLELPRKKLKASKSRTAVQEKTEEESFFVPSKEMWPVTATAPTAWFVALRKGDLPLQTMALHITPSRCLVSDETGTVYEYNQVVHPVRKTKNKVVTRCFVECDGKLFAGQSNGQIVEVDNNQPPIYRPKEQAAQILKMASSDQKMAVSDHRGRLMLLRSDGEILWERDSGNQYGWMAIIHDTGVYHGHSGGVAKLALLDGKDIWKYSTKHPVLDGVQFGNSVYVATGNEVLSLDLYGGKLNRTYEGGEATQTIRSVVITPEGMLIAAGDRLLCFDIKTGNVVYNFDPPVVADVVKHLSGRLFCGGSGGLAVIDMTKDTVLAMMEGKIKTPISVSTNPAEPEPYCFDKGCSSEIENESRGKAFKRKTSS